MLYLVRHAEIGRDAQEGRRGQRADVRSAILALDPDARIEESTGRLLVASEHDLASGLRTIHGVDSFSPCTRVPRDELERALVDRARRLGLDGRSFVVRVRRRGSVARDTGGSMELAAALGEAILHAIPGARVSVEAPDVSLGVELRDGDVLTFHETIEGLDREGAPPDGGGSELRFLADQMVVRLGAWLRLLGYDTRHAWGVPDTWLLRTARAENRVILTRDRGLSRARSARIHLVEADETFAQLHEIVRAFDLTLDPDRLFTRCSKCNTPLVPRSAAELPDRVPADIRATSPEVRVCPACDHVYWHGSHTDRMLERLRALFVS